MLSSIQIIFFAPLISGNVSYARLTKNGDSAKIREKNRRNPKFMRALKEMEILLNAQKCPSIMTCFAVHASATQNPKSSAIIPAVVRSSQKNIKNVQIEENKNKNQPHLPLRPRLSAKKLML